MQLSDTCWNCICCKNKGIGSKRWRNSKLTVFLRGTVSSGLFQHGHVTSKKKLQTPAAGSTDSAYTRNKLRLPTERDSATNTSSLWALCLSRTVCSDRLYPASCANMQVTIIPSIRNFCGTSHDTKLKVYILQVRRRPFISRACGFSQC